jgi:hypothetical protein
MEISKDKTFFQKVKKNEIKSESAEDQVVPKKVKN